MHNTFHGYLPPLVLTDRPRVEGNVESGAIGRPEDTIEGEIEEVGIYCNESYTQVTPGSSLTGKRV